MKLEVNVSKKRFFVILGAILMLAGVFAVYAYTGTFDRTATQAVTFGHSADESVVKMNDGSLRTVQDLLKDGVGGGGSGGSESCSWKSAGPSATAAQMVEGGATGLCRHNPPTSPTVQFYGTISGRADAVGVGCYAPALDDIYQTTFEYYACKTGGGSGVSNIVFINPVAISIFVGAGWNTYDASAAIPAGATAVILEGRLSPGGDGAFIKIRKDSSSPSYYLLSKQLIQQGIYPITADRRFDYSYQSSSIDDSLKIIGYFMPG
ncbi:MAG: hypothetical protein AABX07_00860 [Nanoarchaeota archaeon]